MQNNTFEEIWEKLKSCKKVAMTLHYGPDGDSLGSCTAMKYVLERDLKTEVTLVSSDAMGENFNHLSKEVQFGTDISELNPEEFDAFLYLDSAKNNQSGKMKKDYQPPANVFKINIDHHPTNSHYGELNYVDPTKPAACSVLLEMFKSLNIKFDEKLSTCLLLGISTDTGFFRYPNSEPAIKDASFLIENGADYIDKIAKPIVLSEKIELKKYIALLISRMKINKEKKFGYSILSKEDIKPFGLTRSELRLGVNELGTIGGLDFIFNLIETEDHIKGSFRSSEGVDISLFAEALGGGGHKAAAGFVLDKMPLSQAEQKVLETIEKIGINRYK